MPVKVYTDKDFNKEFAMKTAGLTVFVVEVQCPYCYESQENNTNNALNWTHEELGKTWGTKRTCGACGETFRMPSKPPTRVTFEAVC